MVGRPLIREAACVENNIRAVRESCGLTQKFVYEALGVSSSTYSRFETSQRRISMDDLMGLSQILGVAVDKLFTSRVESAPEIVDEALAQDRSERAKRAVARIFGVQPAQVSVTINI